MPYVMLDTSVALPATLSPNGLTRKFWAVLMLGALTYEVEHRNLELDELQREAEATGGRLGGLQSAKTLVRAAEQRRAALTERLPIGTPDGWIAAGSGPLFDEYERKLREIGKRLNPRLRRREIPMLRRQMEAICVAGPPPFDPLSAPALTRDPKDDPIVLGALLADVDYLISDDRDIVPSGDAREYQYEDHRILAATFGYFVAELCDEIDWDGIDGTVIADAFVAPHEMPDEDLDEDAEEDLL